MTIIADNPVLAEVVRSGFTESVHRGPVIALGSGGEPVLAAGAVDETIFPRSSNKPLQAAAMVRCGLGLDGKLLALAAASHSGEDFHVAGAREILAGAGLSTDALQCPRGLPMDEPSLHALIRRGGRPERVYMNCSGKHAAMLATCVAAGWPTASYRDPTHPLQAEIRRTIERLSGEPVAAVGVDGCGAPIFALSVAGLARAFRAMVLSDHGFSRTDGGRRHADLPGVDIGEYPPGAGADGSGTGAAAEIGRGGRRGVRAGRRPGRSLQDR